MSLVKSTNAAAKVVKAYTNLAPATKQAINQVAQRAASTVAKQITSRNSQTSKRSRNVRRTRMGQRIYSPEDSITTKAIAPVSYATMWQSGAKSMRVRQTEVIGYLAAAKKPWHEHLPWENVGDYSVATFPLNPADPKVFPWLSYIARLYDKYRFHSLKFRYVNSVPTSQLGDIAFALDYDTLDRAPRSIIEASQSAKYQIAPTYCPQEFTVPVSHPGNNPWLYTFDVNVDTKAVDLKTYNLGNLFVMINGVPHGNNVNLGWLAVEYDVELLDKNPITADEIFASQTIDSAAVSPSKRTRSNVDPADTMSAEFNWTAPEEVASSNSFSVQFGDDVAVGSKMRLAINLVARSLNTSEGGVYSHLVIDNTTLPEGVEILENVTPNTYITSGDNYVDAAGYWNLNVVLPESRKISFDVKHYDSKIKFNTYGTYSVCAMAYTYA